MSEASAFGLICRGSRCLSDVLPHRFIALTSCVLVAVQASTAATSQEAKTCFLSRAWLVSLCVCFSVPPPWLPACLAIWPACPAHIAEFLPTNCSCLCHREREWERMRETKSVSVWRGGCLVLESPLFAPLCSFRCALWNSVSCLFPLRVGFLSRNSHYERLKLKFHSFFNGFCIDCPAQLQFSFQNIFYFYFYFRNLLQLKTLGNFTFYAFVTTKL